MSNNTERFSEIYSNKLDKRPNEKVADSQILMQFNGDYNKMKTSAEIADNLPISRSRVRERLNNLEEDDVLISKRVHLTDVWTIKGKHTTPFSEKVVNYLDWRIENNE